MGAVYKALDTTLDRHVAIKFLPPHLKSDIEAKKRLMLEAKAASALNHSNIAVIHEIDETPEGQMFMVMACYDGHTLKDKLEDGPLQVGEAIDIVLQAAEGLSKAHEAGIVHRDIKPANIIMTSDGVAKIVDFGLAKLSGMTKVTRTGMTVGTIAYMSPEQARGAEVDSRTDVFSLGVTLYELLTGHLPFPGDHEAAILYGIMNSDPEPMSNRRRDIPEELQSIIERALHKEPGERYQTVTDLKDELEQVKNELDGVRGQRRRKNAHSIGTRINKRAVLALAASVVILGTATTYLVSRYLVSRVMTSPSTLQISPRVTPLLVSEALKTAPQWSPSGSMIAFDAKEDGIWDIWVCDLDGAHPLNLTADMHSTDRFPAWSPDGQRIAFYSDRSGPGIYTMTVTGGNVQRVVGVNTMLVHESLLHLRWADGDRLIYSDTDPASRADTYEFSLGDQNLRCLTRSQPNGAHEGELSPSGEFLAFRQPWLGLDAEIFVQNMQRGETHKLSLLGRELYWAPDGETLFVISTREGSRDLWAVAIDSRNGAQRGDPSRLTTAVSLSELSFSPTGNLAVGCMSTSTSKIWVFPTNVGPITGLDLGEQITTGLSQEHSALWMPNGSTIVYTSDRRGEEQLWTQELDSGQPVRLGKEIGGWPIVFPDGRWLAFSIMEEDGTDFTHVMRPDGSNLHLLHPNLRAEYPFVTATDWSRDGRHIAFHTQVDGEWLLGVAVMEPETGMASEVRLIGVKGGIPLWSPEGSHLVYQRTDEDNKPDLYVTTPDGDDIYRLTDDPAPEWLAGWSADPSFIYYGRLTDRGDKALYRVAMDASGRPTSAPELWIAPEQGIYVRQRLDFHGNRALGAVYEARSDICLVEFDMTSSK